MKIGDYDGRRFELLLLVGDQRVEIRGGRVVGGIERVNKAHGLFLM